MVVCFREAVPKQLHEDVLETFLVLKRDIKTWNECSRGTSKLGMSGRRSLKNPAACLTPQVTRCVFDMSGHDGHDEFLVSHTFVQGGTSGHHFGVLICPYSLSLGSFFCSSNDFLHACFQGLGLFKA